MRAWVFVATCGVVTEALARALSLLGAYVIPGLAGAYAILAALAWLTWSGRRSPRLIAP